MQNIPSPMIHSAKDLIVLERGSELVLVNFCEMRPLYIERGRERIKKLLAVASTPLTTEQLEAVFPDDKSLIRILLDYKILVENSSRAQSTEIGEVEAVRPREKHRTTLYLLLSESCNQKCIYCLNGPATYQTHQDYGMSAQTAFRSVTMCLDELSPGGVVEIAFFGGEPLIHWPRIKQVIGYCEERLKPAYKDKNIRYHLTSNLTLRPPDLTEWLRKYDFSVVCGIDGPPEIHNRCRPYRGGRPSHARTADTIRQLVAAGVRVTLRATITSANHDCLATVAAHHAELGAASSLFVPLRPVNSDQDFLPEDMLPDPEKIIEAALHLPGTDSAAVFPFNDFCTEIRPGIRHTVACGAPYGTTYVVRPNGDVYPCIYLVGHDRYRLGNVTGTLDDRPLDDMLKALHVDNREGCQMCAWRYACGGGCAVMDLTRVPGSQQRPAIVEYGRRITCDLSRALISEMLWKLVDEVRSSAQSRRDICPRPGIPNPIHFRSDHALAGHR